MCVWLMLLQRHTSILGVLAKEVGDFQMNLMSCDVLIHGAYEDHNHLKTDQRSSSNHLNSKICPYKLLLFSSAKHTYTDTTMIII